MGAGDLKVGDKVRQANGTTGTVRMVKTEQKTQTMYNLDVAKLDTFYVGEQGWLVHNGGPCNIPRLSIPNSQLGKKFADHWQEWGLQPGREGVDQFKSAIESIYNNWDEFRVGNWRDGSTIVNDAQFLKQGNDVIVLRSDGTFWTILKDGIENTFFQTANVLDTR